MNEIITNNQSYNEKDGQCRFGDMILEGKDRLNTSEELKDTFLGIFSKKIVQRYANNLRKTNLNTRLKVSIESIKELLSKNEYDLPQEKELVIHIRLGDVFFLPPEKKQHDNKQPSMDKILKEINKFEHENITFVTAFAHGQNKLSEEYYVKKSQEKSKEFMQKLLDNISSKKKVKIKSSQNVDEDFIYLCMAKNLFITGKSHFAIVASLINKELKR